MPDAPGVPRPPVPPPPPPRNDTWGNVVLPIVLLAILGGLVWVFWYAFVGSVPPAPAPPAPLVGAAAEAAGRADARAWLEHSDNCDGIRWNSVVHRYSVDQEALVSLTPGQEYGREYMSAWVSECAARLPAAIRD